MVLTGDDACCKMAALAKTFPSLGPRFCNGAEYGLDPWDAAKRASCVATWTSQEQQIVDFLLSVWNPGAERGGVFNFVDAAAALDVGDRAALVAWALEPFTCSGGSDE